MTRLTLKERNENVFKTLGRLKMAIKQIRGDEKQTLRALALFDKLVSDVSDMDISLPVEKRIWLDK